MTFQFFQVGGAVRDSLLGIKSKDVDFSVVSTQDFPTATDAFNALHDHLTDGGFEVFKVVPEFFTISAKVPKSHPLFTQSPVADFVLARKDGPSSNSRHPDYVLPGTLHDDLSRRDFTVNAMAIDVEGNLIDPFNGQGDLANLTLRFVGDPAQRIREDALRVVRALRFSVTHTLEFHPDTWEAINTDEAAALVSTLKPDRVRGELVKMFSKNTVLSISLLGKLNSALTWELFNGGGYGTIWLKPTQELP